MEFVGQSILHRMRTKKFYMEVHQPCKISLSKEFTFQPKWLTTSAKIKHNYITKTVLTLTSTRYSSYDLLFFHFDRKLNHIFPRTREPKNKNIMKI